jgi:hypothetical protein|tara:strand:+ start:951 stop:1319 length:369 start_codon:yes stop_codon:yes gene_type:complete
VSRQLTEKQQKFLDVLFDEAKGNPVTAKKLAGYADGVSSTVIMDALKEEVKDLTYKFLSATGTRAAYSMLEVLSNPTSLGNREKIIAAKDLLDRAGFVKTDKVEIKTESPLFILPPKQDEDD